MTPDAPAPTVEELEVCLERCAPHLEEAAEQLREQGHPDAAAVPQVLSEVDDYHRVGARTQLTLEALSQEDRDTALYAIYRTARKMVDSGDDWNPGPLVTLLEDAAAVWGLPGERD